MNRAKLKGLGLIQIDTEPQDDKDYIIALRVSSDGKYVPSKQGEEEVTPTFHLRYVNTEQFMEVGKSQPIKFKDKNSPSKLMRLALMRWWERKGSPEQPDDFEDFYVKHIDKWIKLIDEKDLA